MKLVGSEIRYVINIYDKCNSYIYTNTMSDEWETSITLLLFKKGDKKVPGNYGGINLLCTTLKLTTR